MKSKIIKFVSITGVRPLLSFSTFGLADEVVPQKPVRVFIFAGQSNMGWVGFQSV